MDKKELFTKLEELDKTLPKCQCGRPRFGDSKYCNHCDNQLREFEDQLEEVLFETVQVKRCKDCNQLVEEDKVLLHLEIGHPDLHDIYLQKIAEFEKTILRDFKSICLDPNCFICSSGYFGYCDLDECEKKSIGHIFDIEEEKSSTFEFCSQEHFNVFLAKNSEYHKDSRFVLFRKEQK